VGSASECVKDNITGLTWQRGSTTLTALPGDNQNQEANSVSQNANATRLCGYSDWRVPTRDDLQSLVNYGLNDANSGNPSYALDTLFGFLPPNNAWFISGTQYRSGSSANVWVVNFFTGSVNGIGASGGVLELRLVRGY
jgi:hypothetical protein